MEIKKYFDNKLLKIIVVLATIVILLEYGTKFMDVIDYILALLSPFILGGGMAFVMNVVMKSIEKKFFTSKKTGKHYRFARPFSIACTVLCIVGILLVVVFMIVPQVGETAGELASNVSNLLTDVEKYLDELAKKYPEIQGWVDKIDIDWNEMSHNAIAFLKSGVGGILNSTVNVVGSIIFGVFNFTIGFVFAIYLLFSKETLVRQAKRVCYSYLKEEKADRFIFIARLSNDTFSSFLSGQCVEACILGFMFFITMSIMGLPYPLLIGVLIAFTALIPIFGAFVGSFLAAFLIVAKDPVDALVFLVLFMILQQIEENLIYPHVVGGSVGLPSIWVLVAVTLGGSLMGVIGMLIFIPICSIVYTLLGENVSKQLQKKKIASSKWDT